MITDAARLTGAHEFESILGAAQSGGEWAWEHIFRQFHGQVVGYFRVQGARDPEDLAGDVFLRASKSIGGFTGSEAKFRSWVFTIAHNRLIDERRRGYQRVFPTDEPDPGPDPVDIELTAISRVDAQRVHGILATLTPDQRTVLTLRVVSQLSIEEIAKVVGKRPGAVKALLLRGLRRARKAGDTDPYPNDPEERLSQ